MKPHVLLTVDSKKWLKKITSVFNRELLWGWDRGGTIKIVWKIPKSELSENRKMFALTLKWLRWRLINIYFEPHWKYNVFKQRTLCFEARNLTKFFFYLIGKILSENQEKNTIFSPFTYDFLGAKNRFGEQFFFSPWLGVMLTWIPSPTMSPFFMADEKKVWK